MYDHCFVQTDIKVDLYDSRNAWTSLLTRIGGEIVKVYLNPKIILFDMWKGHILEFRCTNIQKNTIHQGMK